MSTRAVYQPRELYVNSNQKPKRKHLWTTQPCRPGRCINRDQHSKSISCAAVYHQCALLSAIKAKACLAQRCRPGRCINRDQQIKSTSGAGVYHQHGSQLRSVNGKFIWRSCISTAISTANPSQAPPRRHM